MSDTLAANPTQKGGDPKPTPFLLGAVLGGTTLSLLSAIGTYGLEKQVPTPKTLSRDFILGAILFIMIMQLLPESTEKLVTFVISFITIPSMVSMASKVIPTGIPTGISTGISTGIPTGISTDFSAESVITAMEAVNDEIEVKVGVPRF